MSIALKKIAIAEGDNTVELSEGFKTIPFEGLLLIL
jgi:hypothetical protein